MTTAFASAPILVVLVLMVWRRWPASKAGIVGASLALVIAIVAFGFARVTPAEATTVGAFVGTFGEALFTSATILWIVLPALAIHHLQLATGSTDRLRIALERLAGDPRLLALLIGWFFALFVEGAAGFGASVALAAPFLVGIGYRPLDAVVVAMLGHAIGVSFGAVGTPIVPQAAATGLTGLEIAGATAGLHLVVGWTLLIATVVVASRAMDRSLTGPIWGWTALAGVAFLLPFWLIATFVGPELPTLGGSLIGAGIFVAALRLFGGGSGSEPGSATSETPPTRGELLQAGAPYLVLVLLVLVTRLVPFVREPLGAVEVVWTVPGGFEGSFAPLTHPGTLLVVSFLVGALVQQVSRPAVGKALDTTLGQLAGVAVALVAMLSLARIMVHSGMTATLAEAAAGTAGGVWPVLAPLVGVLGTFVTGSATASNVLFTDLQAATADALDLPLSPMLGAQGYGAAVGNIVCPHNIVAAGATVGLTGAEGDVLRRTLAPALAYAVLGGLLVWALVL